MVYQDLSSLHGLISWDVVLILIGKVYPRGGRRGNRGNFGTGVRANISKRTPFIYLAFEKTDPFIYLIIQNVNLFIYCPLIFCTHFLLVVRQISVSSLNTKRISSLEKSLSETCYVHIPGCPKNGAFHIGIQKDRVIHIHFVEERGPIIYLAALKRGLFGTHIHTMPYIGSYAPPQSPPPPTPPPPRVYQPG